MRENTPIQENAGPIGQKNFLDALFSLWKTDPVLGGTKASLWGSRPQPLGCQGTRREANFQTAGNDGDWRPCDWAASFIFYLSACHLSAFVHVLPYEKLLDPLRSPHRNISNLPGRSIPTVAPWRAAVANSSPAHNEFTWGAGPNGSATLNSVGPVARCGGLSSVRSA